MADIGLLVVDQTASMQVNGRAAMTEAARNAIRDEARDLHDLDLRTVTVPEKGDSGTLLFGAIERAIGEIPRSRLAGIVAITDGQIHDVPKSVPGGVPLNVLIPAQGARLTRNGVQAVGKAWPREREGQPFSTCALAFSESWTAAR